jgi:hypothetical protein
MQEYFIPKRCRLATFFTIYLKRVKYIWQSKRWWMTVWPAEEEEATAIL